MLGRHDHAELSGELMRELGEKDEQELIAVVGLPEDRLDRIQQRDDLLVVVFDRPATPGNIGTLIRSADAFGAHGVIVTGHAADPYDPRAVRASTGSLFAVPVVRVPSHREVLAWSTGRIVATDEHGTTDVADADLTGPTVVLIGNETTGLSAAWRAAADEIVRIPITGAASSLNAASAGTVVLYEAARQRRRAAG
jgi:TrmH family RNA methyltransferase